jgi:hypothetical protein
MKSDGAQCRASVNGPAECGEMTWPQRRFFECNRMVPSGGSTVPARAAESCPFVQLIKWAPSGTCLSEEGFATVEEGYRGKEILPTKHGNPDFRYNPTQARRDGRVAEGGGLLNRYRVKSSIGGSNPPLSAILQIKSFRIRQITETKQLTGACSCSQSAYSSPNFVLYG